MSKTESIYKRAVVVKLTVLGYELNSNQNVWANYLIPSIFGCLLYILQTAADIGVAYDHFRTDNPIWASLTLFFMYCPVIACFIWVCTSWEFWPEGENCGFKNIRWIFVKILEHLCFPVWSAWTYAEKIFWSIDALMTDDENSREEALENVTSPRTIEFYFFLQAFLQSLPQVMLQINILMRYNTIDIELETVQAQALSIIMNLIKVSVVTTLYQRFKTQKIGGKDYPWYKPYKYELDQSIDEVDGPVLRSAPTRRRKRKRGIIYATRENVARLKEECESLNVSLPNSPNLMQRRPSSDLYMLPSGNIVGEDRDEVDGIRINRETSVDNPRPVFRSAGVDETDLPRRLREIKSLPEDDVVGKLIACLWWFCFLITRVIAISSFGYFYPRDVFYLLAIHFVICVAFLIYDVKTYVVRQAKAVFYVFIGLIYIFCIIEFMKQFKKAKFIYYGFFALVYVENFVTCLIWWFANLDSDEIRSDWWFRYMFFNVLLCTILSVSTMLFYLLINKPEKVVVDEEVVEGKTI